MSERKYGGYPGMTAELLAEFVRHADKRELTDKEVLEYFTRCTPDLLSRVRELEAEVERLTPPPFTDGEVISEDNQKKYTVSECGGDEGYECIVLAEHQNYDAPPRGFREEPDHEIHIPRHCLDFLMNRLAPAQENDRHA